MNATAESRGHEFSDRIHPFVVKELRQGLRGRAYLALYLLLILVLTIHALFSLDLGQGMGREFSDGVFRFVTGFALAVLLPLNLLGAIGEERRGRKIDLVMLSRVDARGVVLGKWLIAAMQSVTLASLVAPFVVLRYFSGGTNFVDELCYLATMMFSGMIFAAATLCASAFTREGMPVMGFVTRVALIFGGLFAGGSMIAALNNSVRYSGSGLYAPVAASIAILVIAGPALVEIAASKLAPEAVNHDGIIRLVACVGGLVAFGAVALMEWLSSSTRVLEPALCIGFVYTLAVASFTLFGRRVPGFAYGTPTDRAGPAGRLVGRLFLIPGWTSAFLFMLVVPPVWLVAMALATRHAHVEPAIPAVMACLWSSAMWPALLVCPLLSKPSARFGGWLVLETAALLIALMINIGPATRSGVGIPMSIIPTVALCGGEFEGAYAGVVWGGFVATYAGVFLIMFARVFAERRARGAITAANG